MSQIKFVLKNKVEDYRNNNNNKIYKTILYNKSLLLKIDKTSITEMKRKNAVKIFCQNLEGQTEKNGDSPMFFKLFQQDSPGDRAGRSEYHNLTYNSTFLF